LDRGIKRGVVDPDSISGTRLDSSASLLGQVAHSQANSLQDIQTALEVMVGVAGDNDGYPPIQGQVLTPCHGLNQYFYR
jgi:hypothetical protein